MPTLSIFSTVLSLAFVLFLFTHPINIRPLPRTLVSGRRWIYSRFSKSIHLNNVLPISVKQEEPEPVEPEEPDFEPVEPAEPPEPVEPAEPAPKPRPRPRPRPRPQRQRQRPNRRPRPTKPTRPVAPPPPRRPAPTPKPAPKLAPVRSGPCNIPAGRCERMGGMRVYATSTTNGKFGHDWVKTGQCSLTWRPTSNFGGTVPPRTSHLIYHFTPTVTGTFGVSIDMGTKHPTEHNDVWLSCDGGFTLRGPGQLEEEGFVKVYHNNNGRSTESWTVDHNRHSIATREWVAGRTYRCIIGARSTQATVYGLALIPCKNWRCRNSSPEWKRTLRACRFSI